MKLLIALIVLTLGIKMSAQPKTLKASTDKFITVQFPAKVDYYQNSVSIHDKIGIRQVDDILFIQFLEPDVQETNLFVKTVDNKTYNFLLQYDNNPQELSVKVNGSNQNMQVGQDLIPINFENTETISQRLLQESGYIKNRNITTYKNIKLILKGVYVNNNKIYILMRIDNKSNINYDVNAYKFYITNDKGIATSEQTIDVNIVNITPDTKILPKGKNDIVFMFDKFSVGDDKQLLFELTEKNGDRNLSFKILSSLIDNARNYK